MSKELKALLGLSDDASEADVLAAMQALKAQADGASVAIAAARAETPPDAMTSIRAMQTELAALRAQMNDDAVGDLVSDALSTGKLIPAQEQWARNLGKIDVAQLRGYLDTVQPIAALKGNQTGGKAPEKSAVDALDETTLKICALMGVAPADYQKTLEGK